VGSIYRYKDLSLSQLRSFCLVATTGSFTSAGEALQIAAATVWQQVRALEHQLGTTLLRRHGRSVVLTPDGCLMWRLVQPHVSGLDSLPTLLKAQREKLPHSIVVASTEGMLSIWLPQTVSAFITAHPTVSLELRSALPKELVRLIEWGHADLALIPHEQHATESPFLDYEDLTSGQFCFIVGLQHPLARKKRLKPCDLVAYPLLLPNKGTYARRALRRFLRHHELQDQVKVVLDNCSTNVMWRYAALGIGVGVTYWDEADCSVLPGVIIRPVKLGIPDILGALATRKDAHLSEPAQAFRALLRRRCSGKRFPTDN
jgi:DNA-binding transcriptional LysR family regulator